MGLYALAVLAALLTAMVLVIFSGYKSPEQAAAAVAAGVSVADLEGPMSKGSADTLVAAAETKAADQAGVRAVLCYEVTDRGGAPAEDHAVHAATRLTGLFEQGIKNHFPFY